MLSIADQLLRILSRLYPGGLTTTVAQVEYSITVGTVGNQEFATAVAQLRDAGMVTAKRDTLTGDQMLTITARGKKRVQGGGR